MRKKEFNFNLSVWLNPVGFVNFILHQHTSLLTMLRMKYCKVLQALDDTTKRDHSGKQWVEHSS